MLFLFRQFSSFAVVSIIATIVHYCVLIGLVELADAAPVTAALAGYSTGGTVSYVLNRRHVFHSTAPHEIAASRFATVAAAGFGLTYLLMSFFVQKAHVPYLLAQIATTCLVMFFNFAAHRMWTFHHRGPGPSRSPAGAQGQRTSGGSEDNIASTLPPVFKPKIVPRS